MPHYIYNVATRYTWRCVILWWYNLTALLPTLKHFSTLRVTSQDNWRWYFWDIIPYRWVKITTLHGTQTLPMCTAIEPKMESRFTVRLNFYFDVFAYPLLAWKIYKKYIFWVTQHAMRTVACLAVHYFSHDLTSGTIWVKNLLSLKPSFHVL